MSFFKKKSYCFLLFSFFFSFHFYLKAQKPELASGEILRSLQVNHALFGKKNTAQFKSSDNVIYITDTVPLPFLDDFSVNKIKKLNADLNSSGVISIGKVKFTVDGNYIDSIEVMEDTTFRYDFNSSTNEYDTFPNAPYLIVFYNNNPLDSSLLTLPTDTVMAWQTVSYKDSAGTIIDSMVYLRDTVYINSRDTFYYVPDDNLSLWIDSFAYINNGYAVNPPTIGVATFDGVNEIGEPYDPSSPETYGIADHLTSKPIDLNYAASDSLILSFYFQPQGLGDTPDTEDSLVLEFYSPSDGMWHWIWSVAGEPLKSFQRVSIAITDSKFLMKGFRIRFKNYASLSGLFDIWNIDYVYLQKNQSMNEISISDFGFSGIGSSFINTYTTVPLRHYKLNTQETISDFPFKITNLSSSEVQNNSNKFEVYDESGLLDFSSSPVTVSSFAPLSEMALNHTVNKSPGNNYRLPPASGERYTFTVKLISAQTSVPDINPHNDTVMHRQIFDTYYSYDDGSAEKGYAVVGVGAKVAYKFTVLQTDTLKGVYMYFPFFLYDISPLTFQITVWNDNNGMPGNIIYQSNFVTPDYSDKINRFVRYPIETPFLLGSTFYIGWQQTSQDKIYVGFDRNINTQSKIFYKTENNWYNTQYTGSLMIRPDFGEPPLSAENFRNEQISITVYPNPAESRIFFDTGRNEKSSLTVSIIDIFGRLILTETLNGNNQMDVSSLSNGLFFLNIQDDENNIFPLKKLLIAR